MLISLALGTGVGLILSLTGAGGGFLAIPLLIYGHGMRLAEAGPVALLAIGIAAAMGAVIGLRAGQVRYRAASLMAGMGFVGAPIGLWLSHRISTRPVTLLFAVLLTYTSIQTYARATRAIAGTMVVRNKWSTPCCLNPLTGRLHWTTSCARALGLAGFITGVLSSLLGVGGGFVIVPTLLHASDLDMQGITATSLAVIALVAFGSVGLLWAAGESILWATALPFGSGAMAGLLLGRRIVGRLPGPRLQQIFAVVGLGAAILMVSKLGGS